MGLTLKDDGANIAVFSKHASKIIFCLFDPQTGHELFRASLPSRKGDIHFGFITGIKPGHHYGLRALGQWHPEDGHYFDQSKLLLDPYAIAISKSFTYHPTLSHHAEESAGLVPRAVVSKPLPNLPLRKIADPKLIYELNVRGFSKLNPAIPVHQRGTIAALAAPASIAHFKKLGVDTIELLPIAAWIDERHLVKLGLYNAWGYNPVSFFAIEPKLSPGGLQELRDTVQKLHAENINVILDVVFNHTGESDAFGPVLSFRGLDNASYYRLINGTYINDAGCGNTLALDRPHTVELVIAALRHWVLTCGIDGFRFDLATIMGRSESGYSKTAPLLEAINDDDILSTRILIAEPWDIGPGGYQLGHFPNNWYEWNDKYRDDVRRFWRGDAWSANALATRITGSSDVFGSRKPSRSINFISAHDGFTLHDLLNFTAKNNHANGENNRDGKNDEVTCTQSNALAIFATLLFSRGTAMICAGDEFGRTQNGNNNAYAQDNETTWLNWQGRDKQLEESFASLVATRRAIAEFLPDEFLRGHKLPGDELPDAAWFGADGKALDWSIAHNHVVMLVLDHNSKRLCLAINGSHAEVEFKVATRTAHTWKELNAANALNAIHRMSPQSVTVFVEHAIS